MLQPELKFRRDKIRYLMAQQGIDAALIACNVNLLYTYGEIVNGYLYLPLHSPALLFVKRPNNIVGEFVFPIRKPEQIVDLLKENGIPVASKIMLEGGELPYADYMRLASLFPESEVVDGTAIIREARSVKTPLEIELFRRSAALHARAYSKIPDVYHPGMTDRELSVEVERLMRLEGCLGIFRVFGQSMEIFMGSVLAGDNAATPSPYDFALGGKGLDPSLPGGMNGTLLKEGYSKIALLEAQISQLETENRNLLTQIANASVEEAPALRQQHNVNKTKIDNLKKELATWQQQLADIQNAKSEAANDNATSTDDYYRIPAIMQDVKSAYNLTWQGAGSWNGYTYVRTATMPNINGIITFKATLSIARKPKYFLGIKIHRAILQISWELTSEYTDTQVVDVLTLDPNASDEEKTRQVNSRISEIAQEFPSCSITTEYAKSEATQTADNDDVIHLLWSSDRLEIAREVDSRITKIYADLVSLEKMMHYKRSIIDVLKDILPSIDADQGRRRTLIEECYERWRENADPNRGNGEDNENEN